MSVVHVNLDVDQNPPLAGVAMDRVLRTEAEVTFSRVPHGCQSGASSVSITAKLPDTRYVMIECTMANFMAMAHALAGAEDLNL